MATVVNEPGSGPAARVPPRGGAPVPPRLALVRAQTVGGRELLGRELLGCELTERALRLGLERNYRARARLAPDPGRRIELADLANDVRPRTFS
jgi:hypothetical protein